MEGDNVTGVWVWLGARRTHSLSGWSHAMHWHDLRLHLHGSNYSGIVISGGRGLLSMVLAFINVRDLVSFFGL